MTGYGKAECLLAEKKLTIELKSLNSKQLDINTRLPSIYKEKEIDIRQLIASELERGKVECAIHYELSGDVMPGIINETVVKAYYEQLYRISGELGLETSLELLSTVMRLPDTIRTEKAEMDAEEWVELKAALLQALHQLNAFRTQEGQALDGDLRQRVVSIQGKLNRVEPFEKERMDLIRERIEKHLEELGLKDSVDENRLEQELIYYIEKLDITEEKVRLKNHCSYFLETLDEPVSMGKKLSFISQEIGREINTLGSKANDSDIQKIVVQMKDELEKIKEQLFNIL